MLQKISDHSPGHHRDGHQDHPVRHEKLPDAVRQDPVDDDGIARPHDLQSTVKQFRLELIKPNHCVSKISHYRFSRKVIHTR